MTVPASARGPVTELEREPAHISNPVLRGFHPDPSILRVGTDYYVANSTFEWLPAVALSHSRDLVDWRPLGGLLREARLVDTAGDPDSGGVWAPCLSHHDGRFHLVYSDVKSLAGAFKDVRNQVVTAPHPQGPWSDPVPFPGHGFDPSLFHDDGPGGDGRSWALWLAWDHRPGRNPFSGILLQEWDTRAGRTRGPLHHIFAGTALGRTEAPHLYRRDGWYYLVTAEGGTSWEHTVTVARARRITGPYRPDPKGPMLTSAGRPDLALQKAGHGSLVETADDGWYLAHLTARPLEPLGPCTLGRETALQRVEWSVDGWPRVTGAAGPGRPAVRVPAPGGRARSAARERSQAREPSEQRPYEQHPDELPPDQVGFTGPSLPPSWLTLRRHAAPDWLDLTTRPGVLRLSGGESLGSLHRQSTVGRRQREWDFSFDAEVDFAPDSPLQMAGIAHYYNTRLWHYLHLSWDESLGRVLRLGVCDRGRYTEPSAPLAVPDGPLRLFLTGDGGRTVFGYARPGQRRQSYGPPLDCTRLSDEYATEGDPDSGHFSAWGFTGAFLCLTVQDLTGAGLHADFTRPRQRDGAPPRERARAPEDRRDAAERPIGCGTGQTEQATDGQQG